MSAPVTRQRCCCHCRAPPRMGPGSQTTTRRQTACPRSPTTAKLESFVVRSQIWSASGHTLSAPGFAHGGRPQGERHGRQPARVTQGVRDPCVAARQLDRHHLQVPRRVWSPCCPQGSQGVCASLSAHQRQETPTALSAHRQGDWRGGLLAWLRQGFDKSIFSIAPTGQRLKQPQVTDQSSGSCSPPLP